MTPFLRVSINHFEQVNVSWELLGVIFKNERSTSVIIRDSIGEHYHNISGKLKKHIDVKHFSVENIAGMSYDKKHTLEKSPVEILNQVGTKVLQLAKSVNIVAFRILPNI